MNPKSWQKFFPRIRFSPNYFPVKFLSENFFYQKFSLNDSRVHISWRPLLKTRRSKISSNILCISCAFVQLSKFLLSSFALLTCSKDFVKSPLNHFQRIPIRDHGVVGLFGISTVQRLRWTFELFFLFQFNLFHFLLFCDFLSFFFGVNWIQETEFMVLNSRNWINWIGN